MLFDIHPLLSICYSLLIINGLYNLSKIIYESKYLSFLSNYVVSGQIIVFFLVVNFFSIFFYITFLLFGVNKLALQVIVIILILIGFYKSSLISDGLIKLRISNNKPYLLVLLFIFAYFLLSLMPISDPDSLDYHLTVPYLSLLNERFVIEKEWTTSQLAGAGEALSILGLSIDAYKLSSILQFVGLAAIVILILTLNINKKLFNLENKILISLAILCIPSFLFLTFTAKPQLFSIASNFTAFLITFFILPNEKDNKKILILFGFVCFLCLSATQYKFSFYLSSGIIIFFAIYETFKKKLIAQAILIFLILSILIIFPREYYDYKNLSSDVIKNFFQPVTDDYISQNVVTSLKHGSGNPRYFPYWLFLPINAGKISPGVITEIIGLSVLILFLNLTLKKINKIFIASIIFFVAGIFLAQPIGRFFIEPFLWLMTGSLYYIGSNKNLLFKLFQKFIIINSLIITLIISVTVKNFLPGIFSIENYKNTLNKYAEGYMLYEWANKNLPENSVILTSHRSYLFSKYPFVSYDFRLYLSNDKQLEYFIDLISKKKPTHLLYNGIDHDLVTDALKNCRGDLEKFEKRVSKTATRNPLSRANLYYDGYIYKLDLSKLKKCKKL
jgi:hypothetical protein